jgi:hypothetical protein
MSTDYYDAQVRTPPRRSLLSYLLVPLIAFVAGIGATAWLVTHWSQAASLVGAPAAVQPVAAPPRQEPVVAEPDPILESAEPERLVIDPELGRRVTRLEQTLTLINAQSRAAAGNADRAEGLLVAFAARRALDRGVGLGYLEGLLRQRFSATQPQAVATVITTARRPITLQELQVGLLRVGPELTEGGPGQSWWGAFKTEVADMVSIRRAGAPPSMPSERLTRATQRLEAGQVEFALAEVLRMPGSSKAAAWISEARRFVAARRALDALETAALLEPHVPGARPSQPAPAPAATPGAAPAVASTPPA